MFYEPRLSNHGLAHNPFKAIIAPRPIAWISTLSAQGVANLAPYSFFNAVCSDPPLIAFSSDGRKDSLVNIEASGEFVCNLAGHALAEALVQTSAPVSASISEFALAGLEMADSQIVQAPRVAHAPAALECKCVSIERLHGLDEQPTPCYLILGQVVGVHLDEALIQKGEFRAELYQPLARLGYKDYAAITSTFQIGRPKA